jgi:protein-tyrosine phosphatase
MTTADAMDSIYWIIPGRLGGRPGPNKVPWVLSAFKENRVSLVISLTERMVNRSAEFAEHEILHVCIPLPKSAPPKLGDEYDIYALLPHIYEIVSEHLNESPENKIVVHCSSGKDRTGLFMTYFVMRYFSKPRRDALEFVRSRRADLLSAEGWKPMAMTILSRLEDGLASKTD